MYGGATGTAGNRLRMSIVSTKGHAIATCGWIFATAPVSDLPTLRPDVAA
jgi:hypothetical protein